MEEKLRRSNDAWIAGICGGLADYFGFERELTRIFWLLLTIFTFFPGLILYIVLWILMPKEM